MRLEGPCLPPSHTQSFTKAIASEFAELGAVFVGIAPNVERRAINLARVASHPSALAQDETRCWPGLAPNRGARLNNGKNGLVSRWMPRPCLAQSSAQVSLTSTKRVTLIRDNSSGVMPRTRGTATKLQRQIDKSWLNSRSSEGGSRQSARRAAVGLRSPAVAASPCPASPPPKPTFAATSEGGGRHRSNPQAAGGPHIATSHERLEARSRPFAKDIARRRGGHFTQPRAARRHALPSRNSIGDSTSTKW